MNRIILFVGFLSLLVLTSCEKQSEEFTTASLEDYAPIAVGKYITYQLDSFRYQPFSLKDTTITYQVKHVIDALVTDNLGRPSYRIIRYIRKTALNVWMPDNSFSAVLTDNTLEYVENNQRFLKLKLPIKNNFSWKGNSHIDTYSLNSTVRYLDDWDYIYEDLYKPYTVAGVILPNTVKINQRDEIIGNPADPNSYSEKNFGMEIYAKGIGMVYRKFLHTEFQPATPGSPSSYVDGSYGITLTMIDHN